MTKRTMGAKSKIFTTGLLLLLPAMAWCDTVTTKDNLSLNGTLVEMKDGIVVLNARFPGESKMLKILLSSVQSIEFNATSFNPVAPTKMMGIGPAQEHTPALPPEAIAPDLVVLHGNDRRQCRLAKIDAGRVYCDATDKKAAATAYGRDRVVRIQVSGK